MSLNNVQLLLSGDDGVTDSYKITNSLRFRKSATAYLTRTFGTPTSAGTWTWSAWVKRGSIADDQVLFGVRPGGTSSGFGFRSSNVFFLNNNEVEVATSTAVFRDISSWYHVVVKSNGTTTVVYINNTEHINWTGNINLFNGSGNLHYLGQFAGTSQWLYDGYMTEVNFIDGQALTPSSFGASHLVTGVWRPKAYTGTYGTNGFYLPFSDNSALTTSSNAGLGKDFSGNGNYWTTNNISITSGATYDSMTDVPTLTSVTAANYPAPTKLVPFRTWTNYTNGNLTINNGNVNSNFVAVANMTFGTGKYYWESTITANGAGTGVGLMKVENISGSATTIDLGTAAGTYVYSSSGSKSLDGTSSSYGSSYTTGDVIGFTFDGSTGVVTAYKNNTSQGTMTTLSVTSQQYVAAWGCSNTTSTATIDVNFGQRPFAYTPPTGYVALNTYNLQDPAVGTTLATQPNKYMDITLYTGNGSTQSITNASGFKPDLVMIRARSISSNGDVFDSVRGATKGMYTSGTVAEATWSGVTSFDSNGFSLGSNVGDNTNAATYVAWQWQAGQGTTSSNTQGSITSTTSVNATAGFSIVTYTGNGTNATIGHGLNIAPSFMIFKIRSTSDQWVVYHKSLGATQYIYLSATNAAGTSAGPFNNTEPTSTVFSVSSTATWLNANTQTYVAYCWAEIAGFSKFGSYTGNGSADGTFVYTGFRPKFVLTKNASAIDNWSIFNSADIDYNSSAYMPYLEADTTISETQIVGITIDILSNGFKVRGSGVQANGSGNTIIYAAFAENPFKYSLAR